MLYTYTNTTQSVAVNGVISFNTNGKKTCNITHNEGTGSIVIRKPGIYMVHFNASGANSTLVSGNLVVQMLLNGAAVPGSTTTAASSGSTDIEAIGFNSIIAALPNCCLMRTNSPTVLTFVNAGVAATYSNAAVTIVRVGECE